MCIRDRSIPFFQRWAASATVGGVLLWYFLFSAAGLCAVGLLLWLALSKLPSLPLGLTVYGAVLLLEVYWLKQYDVNDALYPLSGFNIFRLLLPAEAAGRYLNYDLLGFPVRERGRTAQCSKSFRDEDGAKGHICLVTPSQCWCTSGKSSCCIVAGYCFWGYAAYSLCRRHHLPQQAICSKSS